MQGKLTELKIINEPLGYDWAALDNYATCVLLVKDRLESVTFFDTTPDGDLMDMEDDIDYLHLFYRRLSRIMDQSHCFTVLTVRKKTDDYITYVESILMKCIHLDTLRFLIEDDFWDDETSQWTPDMIKKTINPVNTIKSLSVHLRVPDNNNLVYYLSHKFLNLVNICISFQSPNPLSSTECSLLISYLNSIPQVKASAIPITTDTFEAMISKQVNLPDDASPLSWGFHMKYDVCPQFMLSNPDISFIELNKQSIDMPLLLEVKQATSALDSESVTFLERYGKYIRYMTANLYPSHLSDLGTLSPDYLLSLFRTTPNLQQLCFHRCTVNAFEWEYEQQSTSRAMAFVNSNIHENLFINLSRVVKTLHQLDLIDNRYFRIQDQYWPYINIYMENTTVDSLTFHSHQNPHPNKRFFFLNVNTSSQGELYYVYDTSKRQQHFELSSKEVFNDTTKADHTHLSLKLNYLGRISVKHANKKPVLLKIGN